MCAPPSATKPPAEWINAADDDGAGGGADARAEFSTRQARLLIRQSERRPLPLPPPSARWSSTLDIATKLQPHPQKLGYARAVAAPAARRTRARLVAPPPLGVTSSDSGAGAVAAAAATLHEAVDAGARSNKKRFSLMRAGTTTSSRRRSPAFGPSTRKRWRRRRRRRWRPRRWRARARRRSGWTLRSGGMERRRRARRRARAKLNWKKVRVIKNEVVPHEAVAQRHDRKWKRLRFVPRRAHADGGDVLPRRRRLHARADQFLFSSSRSSSSCYR